MWPASREAIVSSGLPTRPACNKLVARASKIGSVSEETPTRAMASTSQTRLDRILSQLRPSPTSATAATARPARPVIGAEFLVANYGPLRATQTQSYDAVEATVIAGAIPSGLAGTFVRNGPNPQVDFRGRPFHWFDGDGMLHAVVFQGADGAPKLSYSNRWVETERLTLDRAAGSGDASIGESLRGNPAPSMKDMYGPGENGEDYGVMRGYGHALTLPYPTLRFPT